MPANIGVKSTLSCKPTLELSQDTAMIRRRNSPCLVEAWALAKRSNFMQGIRQLPTNPIRRAAIQCVAGSNHCLTRSGLDRLPGWILPERHCPLLDFPELKSSSFTNTTLFYSLKTTTTQGKWMLLTLRDASPILNQHNR